MTTTNFTSQRKPLRYVLATGAVLTVMVALSAILTWFSRPTEHQPGRLGSPASTSRALPPAGAKEKIVNEFAGRVDQSIQDGESVTSDDRARWWPEHVRNAALAFYCAPKASQDVHNSAMVWTDPMGNVVAYGAAIQGGTLPPYAAGLTAAATANGDRKPIVYPAAQGFSVVAAGDAHALRIGDTALACIPTSGD